MKHKFLSKFLAVTLCVLTAVMSLPIMAFAEIAEPTQIATATASDGTTIKLTLGDSLKYDNNIDWTTHQMYADGRMAYCVNPKLSAPQGNFGSNNLTTIPEGNTKFAMLYKALHYGYDGNGFETNVTAFGGTMKNLMDNAKTNHWLGAGGNSLYYLLTHRVIAKIYGDVDWDYALTGDWIMAVNEIYAALQKAPSLEVKYNMYLLDPKNEQQKVIIMQDKLGSLEVIKDSANHSLTDNNTDCYSLKGTVFTVTNTSTNKQYTVKATTKVNDGSATVKYKAVLNDIPAGKYIIQEAEATKGYAKSNEIKTVTVKAGTTPTSVIFKNAPQNDPVYLLLKKNNGSGKPLSGAEFTIKFYKGYYSKEQIESGEADSQFKRYWTVKTDERGFAYLSDDYLVDSNNDFYYTSGENPNPCLPLGTVTIQETKAPAGYTIDNTLYVQQIKGDLSGASSVNAYNEFTNVNQPNTYYKLVKTSDDGAVANLTFKLYEGNKVDESKFIKTIRTGSDGTFSENLDLGTYTFDEANNSKYIKQSPKTITITANNTVNNPAVVNFHNTLKTGTLKLIKTSEGGNVEGFEFEIVNDEGVLTAKTNAQGTFTKDLSPGTYTIREINLPKYFIIPDEQKITIKSGEITIVNFANKYKRGYLSVVKDADDKFVEGVEFNLYGKSLSGVLVNKTVKTNADGVARFDNILIGDYKLREVNQPDKYIPVSEQDVTINWNTYACTHFDNKLNGTIHTTATDKSTGEHYAYAVENTTIIDKVSYENLGTDTEYKLVGVLMDKSTGKPLTVNGKEVTAEKVFNTGDSGTGSVDMEFTFNATGLENKSVVVFEYLSIKNADNEYVEITNHTDITDEGQTIKFKNPAIQTTAKDKVSGNNTADISKNTVIIDTVNYKGLIANKEYKLVGVLMDKSTGKPLMVNGKKLTAEKTFKATTENGSVDIEFTFDSSALEGKSVVAFETLYFDDKEIAVHTDINDKGQTITFTPKSTEPSTTETTIPTENTNTNISGNGIESNVPTESIATGDITTIYAVVSLGIALVAVALIGISRRKKHHEQ